MVSHEQFEREMYYRAAMHIAGGMLHAGLITRREFRKIETMCAAKYLPVIGQLLPVLP